MRKRKSYIEKRLTRFLQGYGRKRQKGQDPNDRHYDPRIERRIRQMKPEELDRLMRGELDGDPVDNDER